MLTRRELVGLLLGAPLLQSGGRDKDTRPDPAGAEPEAGRHSTLPTGELADRVRLTAGRLARGTPPADDLESRGAHLGAVSLLPPGGVDPDALAREIRKGQRADGGFGGAGGPADAEDDGRAALAELRASGRLLVGLLEHAESAADQDSLTSAVRLGGYVQRAVGPLARPEVLTRWSSVDGLASLTQLAEGLALLGDASGEPRFFETARSLRPLFGPREGRPAAEYLSALRGFLYLSSATGDEVFRRDALAAYRDLAASLPPLLLGAAPETLGQNGPASTRATAELARVSLQVWKVTGDVQALERAEHVLLNALFAAQGASGDFAFAERPAPDAAGGSALREWRATVAAYRALRDAIDSLSRRENDTTFVDLYLDAEIRRPGFLLSTRHESDAPGASRFVIEVLEAAPGLQGLSVRRPAWATSSFARFDGARLAPPMGPRVTFQRRWRAGEVLELVLEHDVRLETRAGRSLPPSELGPDTEAVLHVGPWLMAADDASDPAFFSAPGPGARTVLLPHTLAATAAGEGTSRFVDRARHVRLRHRPRPGDRADGAEAQAALTLAPMSEATGRFPGDMVAWLHYRRE